MSELSLKQSEDLNLFSRDFDIPMFFLSTETFDKNLEHHFFVQKFRIKNASHRKKSFEKDNR